MPERRVFRAASSTLCGAALLTACAHPPIPSYIPPTDGRSAQLLMRGDMQPGETYGIYVFREPYSCSGIQRIGIGTVAGGNPPGTTISALGLSTAEVVVTKPDRSSYRIRWSFEPVVGRRYLIATRSTPNGFTSRVLDATDPDKIVAEPSVRRRDVGGSACVPMAQTSSLADLNARAVTNGESDLPIPATPVARPARPSVLTDDDLGGLTGK